jgi:uncharacterized membrane protein HdeD (DUF308 family)
MELDDDVMSAEAAGWWWVYLLTGIAWMMIGFVVLRLDITSIATFGFLIGGLFVMGAVNEAMLGTSSNGGWKFVHYALAVIFIFGAGWAFINPGESVFTLASILGFVLFFQGTVTIMVSLGSRGVNPLWGLGLAAGILELLLAFWVSQRYYPARLYVILVWVGFMSLFRGIEHIVLAFSVKKLSKEMAAA